MGHWIKNIYIYIYISLNAGGINVQAQGNTEFSGKKRTLDSEKDVAVYRCAICRMLEQNEHMPTP